MDMWMNGFDFPWWGISVLLTGSLAIYSWIRVRVSETRISALEDQLGVFTQASMEVARTLESSLQYRARVTDVDLSNPAEASGITKQAACADEVSARRPLAASSRRYLLQEARSDLNRGDEVKVVQNRFDLQQDELFLLKRMADSVS